MTRSTEAVAPHLLILGASARAAAQSARRGGLAPIAGDLFADLDLQACCPVRRCASYPHDLQAIAAAAPRCPWMYTGALENYPELVEAIAATRPLLGNPATTLRRVRNPLLLAHVLKHAGLPAPDGYATALFLPRDGTFLRKRRRSAGGTHVQVWDEHNHAESANPAWYFQRRVPGTPCAANYVARDGQARFLGLTEQLNGPKWLNARPFQYAGSLFPLENAAQAVDQAERIGQVLAAHFQLQGLFGVDLIRDSSGVLWPLEVNPRYTASMELWELAARTSIVSLHVAACQGAALVIPTSDTDKFLAKAIYFAPRPLTVSHKLQQHLWDGAQQAPPVAADVPACGTRLDAGSPICTLFAQGSSRADVYAQVQARAAELEELLS